MKFKVEAEVEILDDELVEIINSKSYVGSKKFYNHVDSIPKPEILEYFKGDEDILNFPYDISKVTII
jgi:hypothetical protein